MRTWISGAITGAILLCAAPALGQTARNAELTAKYGPCYALDEGRFTLAQRLGVCNTAIQSKAYQGEDLANLYLNRSAILNAKHETALAQSDLDMALATWPEIAQAVAERADSYMNGKKLDLAQADLDRAYKVQPGNWRVLYGRARLHLLRGETDLAAKDSEAALKAQPGNALVLKQQSIIRAISGDWNGAIAILNGLVAEHPDSEAYYNFRCYVRGVAGRELDKALADCNSALNIKPQQPYILDSRGLVYLRMGKLAESIADYTAAITLDDNPSPSSFYGRGLAEQKSGDQMSAAADFQAAESLSPTIGKRFNTLAMIAD